jgi:dynein heavy chain, axonemal
MNNVQKTLNVFKFCNDEELKNAISEDINTLSKVYKNLESYLTMKRTNFSRMYFLSDEELLKILSNTKEPRNINDYVKKIFENISLLVFDEDSMITSIESEVGERVALLKKVSPKEYSVEIWMNSVESMMVESIRYYILEAQKD